MNYELIYCIELSFASSIISVEAKKMLALCKISSPPININVVPIWFHCVSESDTLGLKPGFFICSVQMNPKCCLVVLQSPCLF